MKILLIRHGKTESNLAATYSEETTPLCSEAYVELLATKVKIARWSIDKVYVSPLLRAIDTARIIGLKDWVLDDRLKECNFGVFSGLTYAQVLERYPEEVNRWFADPVNGRPPEGESSMDQYNRVTSFLEEVKAKNQDCIVVAHHGTICMALAWALGDFDLWSKFKPENGGITELNIQDDFISIERFNH